MTDNFPGAQQTLPPARSGPGWRTWISLGLLCFLLGLAVAGYLAWRGGFSFRDMVQSDAVQPAVAPDAPLGPQPSQQASVTARTPDEMTRSAVEIVAVQQGGMDLRLAALEQRMARLDLQIEAAAGNAGRAEALLIAFASRRAIDRGTPLGYLEDQLRLRFGESKPNAVETVIAAGVSPLTRDMLRQRFIAIGADFDGSEKDSFLTRMRREISELFVIRREGAPSPAPRKRVERARWFLESGRIEAALGEVRNLPGSIGLEEWIVDAERYIRTQQALDLLETSAVLEHRGLRDGDGQPIEQPSPLAPPPQLAP